MCAGAGPSWEGACAPAELRATFGGEDLDVAIPDEMKKSDFFAFAKLATAKKALSAAGFAEASVTRQVVPSAATLREAGDLYEMFATATARSRAMLEAQTPAALEAIKGQMAAAVAANYTGTWQNRLEADGKWDGDKGISTGDPTGMWKTNPGAEEKMHVIKDYAAALGGAASGTQWMGGRFKHIVPMPCVVVSAKKA